MKCKEVQKAISAHLDGETTASQWREAEAHIRVCAQCQAILNSFAGLNAVAQNQSHRLMPPQQLWPEVSSRLERLPEPTEQPFVERMRGLFDRMLLHPPVPVRIIQVASACAIVLVALFISDRIKWLGKPAPEPQAESRPPTATAESGVILAQPELRLPPTFSRTEVQRFLDRAGLVLLEVKNSGSEQSDLDLVSIRASSQELLDETMFVKEELRETDLAIVRNTVEQLERILLDIANLETDPAQEEIEQLKATIVQQDLLIKIEIVDLRRLASRPDNSRKSL